MSSDDNTNLTANELEFIANMTNMFRTTLSQRLSGQTSSRDIDKECGYPEDVNMLLAQDYRLMYDKFGIAERVVNLFPDEMWGINPEIYDDATEGVITPFEERFTSICRSLAGESWLIDDKYNPFWEHLWRLDRLAGIGRFGVMLLGLAVEGDLSIPLPGFEDDNDKNKFGYTFNAEAELKKQDKGDRKLTDLLYMRVFDESLVQVSVYETRRNNRRYGLPVYYNITLNDPFISHTGIGSDSGHEVRVHWSRVIHFCDNKMTSEVYGVPRQRSVWPHLLDLRKTYGGSAEMYWQGAFPGLSFETHPQLGTAVKIDAKAMQEQVQSYFNGLQRYFALTGTSAKTLSPQIVDPTSQLEKQLEAICIKLGCPIRIFKGSERGELASSQDKDSWDERMLSRWNVIAVPNIVRPTIDRLIQVGVLPIPSEGYFVHRPDNKKPNKTEQAQIATSRMQAISTYVSSGADVILPPMTFLTSELGYTQEEAKKIIEEAAELNIEVAEETQEYNDAQKEEMAAQGFGAQGGPNFLQGNPPQPGQQPIPSGQEQPQESKPGGPPKGKIPPQLQGKQFQANTGAGPTTFPFPPTENQSELVVNKIVKTGENEWSVLSQEGKNLGRFNSLKKAKNRLRQVEYFKHVNNERGGSDECGSWELVTNEDQEKAKNEGRKLNKPFRTPGGPKKFGVYVKNDKGNVVLVRFGDPNMKIKRDDPDRRASFRARHQCDSNPGPKWKARYWACRTWTKTPVSQVVNFDPNQPRAKDGKWTSDDSNSSTEPQISLEQADSSWEDYGFASLVKSISKGAPLTGTDLAGNPITPEYLREAQQAERILQEQAENNTITPKEKFKGVYRAQFEDSSVNIRDKYKRGSVVEFDSLTAVSLEEGFAQKYLDPQYAGFQDENEWSAGFSGDGSDVPAMVLFNIQSKDNKIPGYNLQHTDLPEAIIPKGSRYKVARVEEYESNKYRITLYNNGKTPHNFGSTVNFDPNQPRDEDGRWTSGGSSSIQLPDYTIKQITQGDRINFLDKSQRHSILKSMGVDRDAVEELDQLFDYHRHGGSSQEYADAKIAEELHRDTPLGNAIRAQIQLEEHLYSELERTRNDWADYHETQSKNEMRRAWENKYPPMNDDAYESWKEQWDSTEKYKIDEMRRPDKFYRKGGATKDVLSTSTNSEGAQSHSVTGAYQPYFKPDNEWSSDELHSMGYRILGGYAFGSMGYSGESEVTWIKYDQPTTNQSRCWEGYEPVPGKEPYSEDSCRPVNSKKRKKKRRPNKTINSEGIWRTTEDGSKIFIKDRQAYAGGPNGPRITSDETKAKSAIPTMSVKDFKSKQKNQFVSRSGQIEEYNNGVERTDLEKQAVKRWGFTTIAKEVNDYLRKGIEPTKQETKPTIEGLSSLLSRSNLPGDVVAYRAMSLSSPPKAGDIIDNKGFTAFTLSDTFAKQHIKTLISGKNTGAGKVISEGNTFVLFKVLLPKGSRVTFGTQSALELIADVNSSLHVIDTSGKFVLAEMRQNPSTTTNAAAIKRYVPLFLGNSTSNENLTTNRIIKLKGNRWRVVSSEGKNLGTFGNEKAAKKRLKQVEYFKQADQTNNAFCPTGPGGGIDNSCPPKKVTSYADAEAVGAQKMYEAQALAKEFTNLMHGEILFGLVEQDKSKFDKLKSHINSMSEEDKTYFKKFLKTAMEDSAAFTKDEMSLVMKSLDTPPTEQKTITSSLDDTASNFVEKLKLGSVGELSMNDIDELNAISQHITDLPSKDQQYVLEKIDNIIAEDIADPEHPEQYQLFMDEKASLLEGAILKQKFETGGGLSPDEEEKLFSLYPGLGTIEATPTGLPSETINPHIGKQFPASLDNLEHVKNMGGSTGATLVRDPVTGNLFVKKTGNNPDHIRNEYRVEQIYKAAGVPVLTSQLYENGGSPVKLSVYQPELVSLGSLGKKEFDVAVAKIQEDFALDATLANWDVVGQNLDNVMVDPVTGVVYRIDVGGSMSFRAQGGLKLSQWNEANNELTSMKESPKNPTAKKIFGPMTDQQMIASITKLENKAQDIQHSMKMTGVSESDQTKFAARLVNAVSHKESIDAAASVQISKPTGSISTPTMDATTLKSVVASKKMGSDFAEKVAFLNPNGIEGNTVFVPMVGGPSGSWKIGNKEAIDHMKSVLPEGTKLQGVMINKVKEGGFKISTKTEETAYKEARKSFGQISLNPYLPGSSKVIPVIGGQITKNAQFDLKELGLPHESPLQDSSTLLQSYKSMEPSEYKAVKDFTGWASGDIRKAFWNPDKASSEDKKTAKEMVKGLKKIPVYNGVVYRGCKSSPNMDKEIEKIKKAGIGAVWSDTAPHSMSRSQKVAAGFSGGRNLFVIKTKTGRSVEGLSSYAGEKEVVGMPGTRYRIVGIHEDAKIDIKFATYKSFSTVVELEEM